MTSSVKVMSSTANSQWQKISLLDCLSTIGGVRWA